MARKKKIPDHIKKRWERPERKRQMGTRSPRRFFLIVCEGAKTETNYFEELKKNLPKGVLDTMQLDILGEGRNTVSLLEKAEKIRVYRERSMPGSYDQVWVVFDRDGFPKEQFNQTIVKAGQSVPQIHCAWSNKAFELWYLLHFAFYQDAASQDQYTKRLEKAISKHRSGYQYDKSDPNMYELLRQYGDERKAIEWAKELESRYSDRNYADHNPCTTVYRLVEELNAFLENK
ncbi:MAG: hypothetical protein KIPDCIKN_00075 [Haliscomenobacter sp.]|jgi:hypothetical protein|nr:hypothetical protein [Haliscomenobacter sp.]